MKESLLNRERAWNIFFIVSGVFEACLERNEPIPAAQLHYLPYHPLTKCVLYIYEMECSIRYAVNHATKIQDDDAIMTLGPYAQALKAIMATANYERERDYKAQENEVLETG